MDMNYILGREQISLHNAAVATTSSARIAHEGLAAAYGALLDDSPFPHRTPGKPGGRIEQGHDADFWDGKPGLDPRHGDATSGHIVQTPNEGEPYKVVLEHEDGSATEQPVPTIRKGEDLIRKSTPRPLKWHTPLDRK